MPDGGVAETTQPTRKSIEAHHDSLPVLTPQDLLPQSTFSPDLSVSETQPFFEAALRRAISRPWELLEACTGKSDLKRYPMYQRELVGLEKLPPEEAQRLAHEMVDSATEQFSEATAIYLIMSAFREMQKAFPDLSFFRSAQLTHAHRQEDGYIYDGIDFAPGAFAIAERYYHDSFGGRARQLPVMAVAPMRSVVSTYQNGELFLRTEGSWWRGSMELNYDYRNPPRIATLWRLPDDHGPLLAHARRTGIQHDDIARFISGQI